jgi:hypothetical protein
MNRKSLSMIAIPGLLLSLFAQAQTAAPPLPAERALAPHIVPTNLPGVYAFTQPPADFNPLTASSRELESWGYPPRPDPSEGPSAQARWLRQVDPKLRRSVPDLILRPDSYNRQQMGFKVDSSHFNITDSSSSNWSGVAIVPGSGGAAFDKVTAQWIVPTVKQAPGTCSGGWDYSSEWVGIGGFSDSFLLQAGSAANVFCDIGENVTEYFPWLEWLPAAELVLYQDAATSTLYPFEPGDYLDVTITATKFSSGVSTTGTLYFEDATQGWTVSLSFSASSLGGSEVTGQSVEWILERTEVGGALATLPDYVANAWVFAGATDLNAVNYNPLTPNAGTAYNITMLDNNSNPESHVEIGCPSCLWFYPEGSAVQ